MVNGGKHKGKLPYLVILDHYTARLRLDILLGGSIILTDAMFFDGAYFQALFLHQEKRADFVNFLRLLSIGGLPPLIEIRQRGKTVGGTLKTMLYRKGKKEGFIFSSLGSDYLKSEVAKALSVAQNKDQDASSWKKFIQKSLEYVEEEVVKDALKQKIETLSYMDELPANIFRTWDGKYDFQKVLHDAQDAERFRIIRTGEPIIDSVIASIEKEIEQPFPNRSKLQDEIARKTKILSRPPTIEAEQRLEHLWGQFLQVYNRTIGIQHYCDSFDIGEIPLTNEKAGAIIIENLSQSTLQALAHESWTTFAERYNNLSKYREKWLYEVWQLEDKKKESNKDARKALDNLIKHILREYKTKPSFKDVVNIVGGGASIDLDLMNANGISLGVSTTLLNIPVQTIDLAKKQWTYIRDKANLTEYGQNFEKGF